MKVIANIPEEMVQELKDGCFGAKHTLYDLAGAICDGVVLPDNATNGDVIKALFPNATVYSYKDSFDMYSDVVICPQNSMLSADRDFWNAPYKGGQEDGKA